MSDYRGWAYREYGDYHRNVDPGWSYTPTYLRKMAYIRRKIEEVGTGASILDAGCGEGVLVESFVARGFDMLGLDMNYESDYVQRGSVTDMPYEEAAFDLVLLLDVFEHISFVDQPTVLQEIRRVLRPGGTLIASIPNLAHLNSRFRMALLGQLDRTDTEINHVGERPFRENVALLKEAGFRIDQIKGVTLTVPVLYRGVICRRPAWFRWLHDMLEPLAVPPLAMLDIFVCRRS